MKLISRMKISTIALILLMIIPVFFVCVHSINAQEPMNGLISYWGFNEGNGFILHDSKSMNNGTIDGATWTTGKVGNALSFDGSNKVTIPDSPSLNPSSITVEVWVKLNRIAHHPNPNTSNEGDSQDLVCKGSLWDNGGYFLQQGGDDASTTTFYFQIAPWYTLRSVNSTYMVLETNRWYYVVGTYDGDTLKIYLDGVLKGTKQIGKVSIVNESPLYMGYEGPQLFNFYLNGTLDEVAIYNYAKTPEQIMQNYLNPGQNNSNQLATTPTAAATPTLATTTTSTPVTSQSQTPLDTKYFVQVAIAIGAVALIFLFALIFQRRRNKTITAVESPSTNSSPFNPAPVFEPPVSSHIFISHVEEDADVAKAIAKGLEKVGFRTWYYERDSKPGPSYLLQTSKAIEESQAIIVIISPHSLSSRQVTVEVIRGHEAGKNFVPLLRGISHIEFQKRQPEWREAIGSATSTVIPEKGVTTILPRIIDGLTELGVKTEEKTKSPTS